MERREALRLMGAASVFSVLSSELFAATLRAQIAAGNGGGFRTLSPAQNEIVVAMCDVMIPATETPGAKAAKVNEFIDLILTDWATEGERKIFLAGLSESDRRSNELFGHGFAAASAKEQTAIVQVFDEELATTRNEKTPKQIRSWELTLELPFFAQMRRLTLVGYYTSSIGQEQELKVEIIPGSLHGCVSAEPEVKQ
ncbi:MAG TPA: gluconate 2-dehydrogenase subunit 3 family protein [Candidatus Limnocylindrales bacterium]|nr:gluconate 2-dehydrogenase subunit 3 family protein [Candidatus Limnocylindrales bacterium]